MALSHQRKFYDLLGYLKSGVFVARLKKTLDQF